MNNLKLTFHDFDTLSKDQSKSSNGGEYSFGSDILRHSDGRKIQINKTSSEFEYCQVKGTFSKCYPVLIEGTDVTISVDESLVKGWDRFEERATFEESMSFDEIYNIQNKIS